MWKTHLEKLDKRAGQQYEMVVQILQDCKFIKLEYYFSELKVGIFI